MVYRSVEDMIRRAPPHRHQNRKRPNMCDSTPMSQSIGSCNICPTNARNGNYNELGLHPTSIGDSLSFLFQSENIHNGIVPQNGGTKAYLYLQDLSSTISKASTNSCSSCKEGYSVVPRVLNQNPSENMRSLLKGGASRRLNSRKQDYQLPHQLSSFYHDVPHTHGKNGWNHSQCQRQQWARYQCSYPKVNEQVLLPSYQISQHTNNISHISRARATLSPILEKCPTMSNLAQSFFQPPPSSSVLSKRPNTRNPIQSLFHTLPSNVDDIGSQCKLETDQLLTLFQSMGTPKFLATSNELLRPESSLHDPLYATSAHIPIHGTSASYAPNLLLGIGNGRGIVKGKSKEVCSYWDLDDMVEMMESMEKRRKVTSQPMPELTLGSNDWGSSKNKRNQSSAMSWDC